MSAHRERHLVLSVGEVALRMGLHEVLVTLNQEAVGRLGFRALGSANNADEPPLYRLREVDLVAHLQAHHEVIINEAIGMFAQYTGAKVIGLKVSRSS
ncbi:hypothetical protein LG201_09825 [Methylobacillus gramineus]|uniref:hypothetical protein n=1 Tax=Methylobacillus gramineus TaxID=755169 RepID=UPI001CFF5782|nr:hypothetical protein [Methylobacillus gramineus]MCB5185498.1 hypothetical protein [Methylobacillus gramineus]